MSAGTNVSMIVSSISCVVQIQPRGGVKEARCSGQGQVRVLTRKETTHMPVHQEFEQGLETISQKRSNWTLSSKVIKAEYPELLFESWLRVRQKALDSSTSHYWATDQGQLSTIDGIEWLWAKEQRGSSSTVIVTGEVRTLFPLPCLLQVDHSNKSTSASHKRTQCLHFSKNGPLCWRKLD